MAKRKTRAVKDNFEEHTLSSGIVVRISALPVWLHNKIIRRVNDEFEEPEIPLKTVKTVDGKEEIEDLNHPEYVEEKDRVDRQRKQRMAELLGEAVCDLAVEVVTPDDEVEEIIKRLEKYTGPFPTDPADRRVEFLTSYAIKNTNDYQLLITSSTNQMIIRKEEVDKEIDSFPGDLEGAEVTNANSSGVTAG